MDFNALGSFVEVSDCCCQRGDEDFSPPTCSHLFTAVTEELAVSELCSQTMATSGCRGSIQIKTCCHHHCRRRRSHSQPSLSSLSVHRLGVTVHDTRRPQHTKVNSPPNHRETAELRQTPQAPSQLYNGSRTWTVSQEPGPF